MPTMEQLEAEPWWDREVVTDAVDWLADKLCDRYGLSRSAAGTKGNMVHLRGAHRSQEWILNSAFCTSRSYTVQSGLSAWQKRLIAGLDFTPGDWGTTENRAEVAAITKRLVGAAKAGRLNGVVEIGGTLDGHNPYGWHVLRGVQISFDSSHVDHNHLTLDRTQLENRNVMENILAIMTGDDMSWEDKIDYPGTDQRNPYGFAAGQILIGTNQAAFNAWGEAKALQAKADKLVAAAAADETRDKATLAALEALASGGTSVDTALVLAKIKAESAATRELVEQRHQAEMAELAGIHAAQLAERDAEVAGLRAELDRLTGTAATQ